LGFNGYEKILNIKLSLKNQTTKLLNLFTKNYKQPVYLIGFLFALISTQYKQVVDFYSNSEVVSKLNEGFSLIRLGDGEIASLLGYPMPYHDPNSELSNKMKQLIKGMRKSNKILFAIPKHITISNKSLSKQGKKNTWLPFKVVYFLQFPKKIKYVDAHSFYDETIFNQIKDTFLSNKNLIIVTKAETIQRLKESIASNQVLIPCTDYNAYDDYEKITSAIKESLEKFKYEHVVILFALGPVGKVMAYEFARQNIQCIDIGKGLEKYATRKYG
jgi:hypothetical protein